MYLSFYSFVSVISIHLNRIAMDFDKGNKLLFHDRYSLYKADNNWISALEESEFSHLKAAVV
jgi:hypothetical protein